MLRPEPMKKVTLIVRSDDAKKVIALLATKKILHIVNHKRENIGGHDIDIGIPMEDSARTAEALVKCNALLSRIQTKEEAVREYDNINREECIEKIMEITKEAGEKESIIGEANTVLTNLKKEKELISLLPPQTPLEALTQTKSVKTILFHTGRKADHNAIKNTAPLIIEKNTEAKTVLLTYDTKNVDEKVSQLTSAGYSRIDVSALKTKTGNATDAILNISKEEADEKQKIQSAQAFQKSLDAQKPFLLNARRTLSLALLQMQAPTHFGKTKHTTYIQGYIPQKKMSMIEEELIALKIPISLEKQDAEDGPTHLQNAKPARPFEDLVAMYTLPRYNELDPTSIMAITFPLFFGFMLGDIGYGAVLLLASLYVAKKYQSLKGIANIVTISAISSILFGVFFGEAFGAEQLFGLHLTPVFHRAEDPALLLSIAGLIGIVHVNIGLLLGVINASRDGIINGVLHKGGWFLLQIGAFFLLASTGILRSIPLLSQIPETKTSLGWILLTAGILLILHAEHLHGLLELPMIFSHILSYLRLAAIGLASVALALVTNDLGSMAMAKGGMWIVLGAIIILLGHTINVLLGLLGPFLHSLRLHYAEFFMKFYEGGGKPYRPFGQVEENA